MGKSWEARVAEYVDSDRLMHRMRIGSVVSCRILGNYGIYRTEIHLGTPQRDRCTCPYEGFPCKHIVALRRTHARKPRSFRKVDSLLHRLAGKSKQELLQLIRTLIEHAPESLSILGVKGFERIDERDPDDSEG